MFDGLRDRRRERRTLLTVIAALLIATSIAMGIVYVGLFDAAASDLTRILPARTSAWFAAPAPWPRLARIVALDRWRAPEAVADLIRTELSSDESLARRDVAGVPVPLLREMARAMDGFEVAVIPGEDGGSAAVLVFVEIADPVRRKRVLTRLGERTDGVDRHVGYRIDALREDVWQRWAGALPAPPRVVFMDPWIVFAFGSDGALEELLDARIEGRDDAIRRRRGFVAVPGVGELRGAVDVGTLWRFANRPDAPSKAPPMATDGLLAGLSLLSFGADTDGGGDRLDVRAEVADRGLAGLLRDGLRSAPHELMVLGPADTRFGMSLSGTSPTAALFAWTAMAERLERDWPGLATRLGPVFQAPVARPDAAAAPNFARLADRVVDRLLASPPNLLDRQPFEAAFFLIPRPDGRGSEWFVLIRSDEPEALEGELAATAMALLGEDLALGEIATPEGSLFALTDPDGRPHLVWQRRLGLIELAPSLSVLERTAAARAEGRTLGDHPELALADSQLGPERALTLYSPNPLLREASHPLLRIIANALVDTFAWVATVDFDGAHLHLQTNVGPWTALASVATASPRALDNLFLPGLSPECRARHEAMCRAWPQSPGCQPFELGRLPRILKACNDIERRRTH